VSMSGASFSIVIGCCCLHLKWEPSEVKLKNFLNGALILQGSGDIETDELFGSS